MSTCKVAILPRSHDHARRNHEAMRRGLQRHGITPVSPETCDVLIAWGVHQQEQIQACVDRGGHYLVMEAGHVGDRLRYTSCGWDGLAGRGRYPDAPDGDRWGRLFGGLMRPWRTSGSYALLIGQVPTDAAVADLPSFQAWANKTVLDLHGYEVVYRPHPLSAGTFCPPGARLAKPAPLSADLADAACVVAYSSTASIEAVLFGVPTVTMSRGAMAWPVTSHVIGDLLTPDRTAWAHRLAYAQWSLDELASGEAWAFLRETLSHQ